MESKGDDQGMTATPIACHGTWLKFLNAMLDYLRDVDVNKEQQREDLAKIKTLAHELKAQLPNPHEHEGVNVDAQIDEVIRLAEEYFPSEGDSPELSQAIMNLNQTIQEYYGIS